MSSNQSTPSAALARSHVWRHRRDDVLAVLRCYYGEGIPLSQAIMRVCAERKMVTINIDSVRRVAAALAPEFSGPSGTVTSGASSFTKRERALRLEALDKVCGAAEKSGAGRKGRR